MTTKEDKSNKSKAKSKTSKSKKKNMKQKQSVNQTQVVKINIGDLKKTKKTTRRKPSKKPPSGYYPSDVQRSTVTYNSIPSLVNPRPIHPSVYNLREGDTAPFYSNQGQGLSSGERVSAQGKRIVSVDDATNTLSKSAINPLLRTPITNELTSEDDRTNTISSMRRTPIKDFTDTISSAIKKTPIDIYGRQNIKNKERRSAIDMLFGLSSGRPRISEATTQVPYEEMDDSIFTANDGQEFTTPIIDRVYEEQEDDKPEEDKKSDEEKASIITDFNNDDDLYENQPDIARSISFGNLEEEEKETRREQGNKRQSGLFSTLKNMWSYTMSSKVTPNITEEIEDKIASEPSIKESIVEEKKKSESSSTSSLSPPRIKPKLPFLEDLRKNIASSPPPPVASPKMESKKKESPKEESKRPLSFLEEIKSKQGKLKKVQFAPPQEEEEKKEEEKQPLSFLDELKSKQSKGLKKIPSKTERRKTTGSMSFNEDLLKKLEDRRRTIQPFERDDDDNEEWSDNSPIKKFKKTMTNEEVKKELRKAGYSNDILRNMKRIELIQLLIKETN